MDTFHAVYESWIIIVASVSLRSLLFLVIQRQTKVYYTFNYFLIRFVQTKITLFIFVNKWVIRENESFLLVEPCSRVTCCVETKLQYFFRKYIFICTIYTLLCNLFRQFFTTRVKFMVAATLEKNLRPPEPNRAIVSDSFAYRKTKSYTQHGLCVLSLIF